jgi:hypothetical protein
LTLSMIMQGGDQSTRTSLHDFDLDVSQAGTWQSNVNPRRAPEEEET